MKRRTRKSTVMTVGIVGLYAGFKTYATTLEDYSRAGDQKETV